VDYLFKRQDYNPLIRPVKNLSDVISTGFEMALIQLITLVGVNFLCCNYTCVTIANYIINSSSAKNVNITSKQPVHSCFRGVLAMLRYRISRWPNFPVFIRMLYIHFMKIIFTSFITKTAIKYYIEICYLCAMIYV